jgi:hypothetical protein
MAMKILKILFTMLIALGIFYLFSGGWYGMGGPWNDSPLGNKVVAAGNDLRVIAVAIEAYNLEHGTYPAWDVGPNSINDSEMPSFSLVCADRFKKLSKYGRSNGKRANGHFKDPFAKKGRTFCYFSSGEFWALWSPGPDEDYDITIDVLKSANLDGDFNNDFNQLQQYMYSLIDGDFSDGDLIRIKNW